MEFGAARIDPYEHWIASGAEEGRLPSNDPFSLLDNLLREREQLAQQDARTESQERLERAEKELFDHRISLQAEVARVQREASEKIESQLRELAEREKAVTVQILKQQETFHGQRVQFTDAADQKAAALAAESAERERLWRQDVRSLQERLEQTQTQSQETLEQVQRESQERLEQAQKKLLEQRAALQEEATRARGEAREQVESLLRQLAERERILAEQLLRQQGDFSAQRAALAAEFGNHELQLRQELRSFQERSELMVAEDRTLLWSQYSSVLTDLKRDLEVLQTTMSWRLAAPIRAIAAAFGSKARLPQLGEIDSLMHLPPSRDHAVAVERANNTSVPP